MKPTENRLLASLPLAEFASLTSRMTDVTLQHKELCYRAGAAIDHVYFPRSGVVSAVIVMEDGATAEVAAIGREGMVGASVCLGATRSPEQVFCQVPTVECRRLPAAEFAAAVEGSATLRGIVHRYLRAALTMSARNAACNCLHSVDERCARWLLLCRDRVGDDEFNLTHEFLAVMLGVRRATVSVTAGSLQSAGLITYRHGQVRILDSTGLEEASCECYRAMQKALDEPN